MTLAYLLTFIHRFIAHDMLCGMTPEIKVQLEGVYGRLDDTLKMLMEPPMHAAPEIGRIRELVMNARNAVNAVLTRSTHL